MLIVKCTGAQLLQIKAHVVLCSESNFYSTPLRSCETCYRNELRSEQDACLQSLTGMYEYCRPTQRIATLIPTAIQSQYGLPGALLNEKNAVNKQSASVTNQQRFHRLAPS